MSRRFASAWPATLACACWWFTGDLVQGTVTPKLLERAARGLTDQRRLDVGSLPTADEVGGAIAAAALDPTLASGHTVVIGGGLDSLAEF